MRIEVKGLIAAVLAGLAVVGGAFGVSALVVRSQAAQESHQAADLTRSGPQAGAGVAALNAGLVAPGHAFFTQSCSSCHGSNGQGAYGPSLHHEDMSDAKITQTIKNGVQGKMPAFANKYNDTQIQAMVAYIRSLK